MTKTLYGITPDEARILALHFNNDAGVMGIALWSSGRANTPESGVRRAVKLIKFAKEA